MPQREHFCTQGLLETLLEARGVAPQSRDSFLHPKYEDLYDPFLFQDMRKACQRIFDAITHKEKITIHGDYDADGVCSSALLSQIIKDLGGEVDVYIPHREKEGYGVAMQTVETIASNKTNLLITVDCGSANKESLEYAQSLGIDVIITDHHHVPKDTPQVFALINPQNPNDHYPFGYLCGTGVAFKVAQALCVIDSTATTPRLSKGYDKWLLDLVAVATIADMMSVLDENRILITYGLKVLQKTKRKGLKKLMELAGLVVNDATPITPYDIGFVIAPRLNAAGRMDHANAAFFLLTNQDDDAI
ncbi:DHH family phosphoesterase, partial [Candidatus Falkowbacteria bacterium]|nr:DHH family phosphoesterase [Candidatus Falkowbacteria bacterium]